MPRMRILSAADQARFEHPPDFDSAERKGYLIFPRFVMDTAQELREPANRIGFLLAYGYFRASRRFFLPDAYHERDIAWVSRAIDLPLDTFTHWYITPRPLVCATNRSSWMCRASDRSTMAQRSIGVLSVRSCPLPDSTRGCGKGMGIRADPTPEGLWRGSVARMAWVVTRKDGLPCELRAFLDPRSERFGSKSSNFGFKVPGFRDLSCLASICFRYPRVADQHSLYAGHQIRRTKSCNLALLSPARSICPSANAVPALHCHHQFSCLFRRFPSLAEARLSIPKPSQKGLCIAAQWHLNP